MEFGVGGRETNERFQRTSRHRQGLVVLIQRNERDPGNQTSAATTTTNDNTKTETSVSYPVLLRAQLGISIADDLRGLKTRGSAEQLEVSSRGRAQRRTEQNTAHLLCEDRAVEGLSKLDVLLEEMQRQHVLKQSSPR